MEEKEFDFVGLLKSKPKIDKISLIIFFVMICACLVVTFYFITEKVNSCTRDPLKYSYNILKEKFPDSIIYGTINVIKIGYKTINYNFGDELNLNNNFNNLTLYSLKK